MPIKSRQIVPLVGLGLCVYLAKSGGMSTPKPGNFAREVRELPTQSDYSCPPLPSNLRNPFLTDAQWAAYLKGAKYAPGSVLPSRAPPRIAPVGTPKPSVFASVAPIPIGVRQMSLGGVLLGPQQRSAVVNGDVITEGDHIGAYLVTKIELDGVRLSKDGQEHILHLPDALPPPLWFNIDPGNTKSTKDGPIPVTGSPPPGRRDDRLPQR